MAIRTEEENPEDILTTGATIKGKILYFFLDAAQ